MDLTRRSFLAGLGGVSVGLLFHRHLGAVLDSLERDSAAELVAEPVAAGQLPAAAEIIVTPVADFRPEHLMIPGVVVGKEIVPEQRFVPCVACDGGGDYDEICRVCLGTNGKYVDTGNTIEREIRSAPWIIEDISIGGRSQLAAGEGIPADIFMPGGIDPAVMMDAAAPGAEIRFRVRYTGTKPEGEVFCAALLGRSVDGSPTRMVLPLDSVFPIAA